MADSDGDGGSFLPDKPFAQGETVTVSTGLNISGGSGGSFRFVVATPAGRMPPGKIPFVPAGSNGVQRFHSRTDLQPPAVQVTHSSSAAAPGDIFVGPQFGPAQDGAMVFDPAGNLVWFNPVPRGQMATDVRVQTYQGKPVLTWWQGYENHGLGVGGGAIDDTSYRRVATVHAANGLSADLHEFFLTPRNTALVLAASPVYVDASSVQGTARAVAMDGVIQEIDIPTGLVEFEWHSLDHVALNESHVTAPRVAGHLFDYFHLNSAGLDADGDVVASARNTWAMYKINIQTGAVIWRLGGKRSSFKMKAGTTTAWQHDARMHSDGTLTVFDDGALPPVHKQSRALRLHLDLKSMTASWLGEDEHSSPLLAGFEGNDQVLPNGDSFVGWGQQPYFTEFAPRGQTLFDSRFLAPSASYRAYRFEWSAQPATRLPAAAVGAPSKGVTSVDASWNGATTVASWRIFAGPSPGSLHSHAPVTRRGFETAMLVHDAGPYFKVQALGSSGQVLGSSATVKAP